MKLVLHILRKDFLRLRGLLALWGGLVVVQYVVWRINGGGFGAEIGNQSAVKPLDLPRALWWLHLLVAWWLVAPFVQGDDLVSERAAWRTLPISGARLLSAKLLGLALMFCVWPSLLTGLWWAHLGFGSGEIVRLILMNALGMAVVTVPAFVVAALTEDFARFTAWSIVLILAVAMSVLAFASDIFSNGLAGATVTTAISALTLGLVTVLIFLTRRARLARSLMVGGLTVAALAGVWFAIRQVAMPAAVTATMKIEGTTLYLPEKENEKNALVDVGVTLTVPEVSDREIVAWWGLIAAPPALRATEVFPEFPETGFVEKETFERSKATAAIATGEGNQRGLRRSGQITSRFIWPRDASPSFFLRARGVILRACLDGTVPLQNGAGGGVGLHQLHVENVTERFGPVTPHLDVSWFETEPLFLPSAILGAMRFGSEPVRNSQVSIVGGGAPLMARMGSRWNAGQPALVVGLLAAVRRVDIFASQPGLNGQPREEFELKKARLAKVRFSEERRVAAVSAEKVFAPDLVVDGRIDDALNRAQADKKPVMVRVYNGLAHGMQEPPAWHDARVRALLGSQFICAQVSETQAAVLMKKSTDDARSMIVVLNADGTVRDRIRDLWDADELILALRANLDGKSYVEALREKLAARGGDDRTVRFQLVEALRVRGELAGVLDNMLWLLDHPKVPFERLEVVAVGERLERLVAEFGPARNTLLERRAHAAADLRREPRNEDAARLVFEITLALRHDDPAWREFPGLLPKENPSWWDFMANWIALTVGEKRYAEVVNAVDVEKFFAEGPTWVRAQLVSMNQTAPAEIARWHQQLAWTGAHCVEALAGAGQPDRALRLAEKVLRTDGVATTREMLVAALQRSGAGPQAAQLSAQKPSAP